jgi:hypothetical protein
MVMIIIAILPAHVFCSVLNVTKMGLSTVRLTQSDILFLDTTEQLAVFPEIPRDTLEVSYQPNPSSFFPVTVPEFSVTGFPIFLRTRCLALRLWLLPASVCPDGVAILSTANSLLLETSVGGPICLFPALDGTFYRLSITTLFGLPNVAYFSSRGVGRSAKRCIGESNGCILESHVPFFAVLHGDVVVNISYRVDGLVQTAAGCRIRTVVRLNGTRFATAAPRIEEKLPLCLPTSGTIAPALVGIMIVIAIGLGFAGAVKIVVGAGRTRCGLDDKLICARLREEYRDCL